MDMHDQIYRLMEGISRIACAQAQVAEVVPAGDRSYGYWHILQDDLTTHLGKPPVVTAFKSGGFEWTIKERVFRFSLSDVLRLDPNGDNLSAHVSCEVMRLADRLQGFAYDPCALAAALKLKTTLRPRLCALSVKVAYPKADFCRILMCSYHGWRYKLRSGSLKIAPPFKEAEYNQAEKLIASASMQKLLSFMQTGVGRPSLFSKDPTGCTNYLFT